MHACVTNKIPKAVRKFFYKLITLHLNGLVAVTSLKTCKCFAQLTINLSTKNKLVYGDNSYIECITAAALTRVKNHVISIDGVWPVFPMPHG